MISAWNTTIGRNVRKREQSVKRNTEQNAKLLKMTLMLSSDRRTIWQAVKYAELP